MSSNSGDVEDTISGAFVLVDNKVFRRQTRLAWQTLGHFRATNQSHSKIVDPLIQLECAAICVFLKPVILIHFVLTPSVCYAVALFFLEKESSDLIPRFSRQFV